MNPSQIFQNDYISVIQNQREILPFVSNMQGNLHYDYAIPTHPIYLTEYLTNHQESSEIDNEDMIGLYTNNFYFESAYDFPIGEQYVQASTMEGSNTITRLFESSAKMKPFNEKRVRIKWTKKSITLLLSFLNEHKQVLKELVEKRGGSGNIKKDLWMCASIVVSDNENQYLPKQCEFKWKNIKQVCKHNPDCHYKLEVKEILECDRF
ncbi:7961_t:CDS:2 [Funneliformis geosporum]|uniref:788_t:CDS:1 n=1 Tax=Funneliformis geosporum TaxID=1117311 RepID=A0A9W4T1R6_9GLOM|nr:7961_t:CDS:2 [Funneliformis geosporum]CAI2187288.1 788_t:CDS:2 [Funneliformis geosporum]